MKKNISLAIFFLLVASSLYSQAPIQGTGPGPQAINFAGDYYFIPPPGVTTFTVELYGAGGGGNPYTGWGGGGGAYSVGTFTLNPSSDGLLYLHVGNGGTSAQSGESSIVSWRNIAGKLIPFVSANGGLGAPSSLGNGIGGPASPQYAGVTNYTSNRGGNASYLTNGYYGAGGGCADVNGTYDATAPTGSGCNFGGISSAAGSGGNGAGFGCLKTVGGFPGGGGGSGPGAGANGGGGSIVIYWTCPTASDIGSSHTTPYPQEKNPDYLMDAVGTSPTGNGLIYSWEQSRDGVNGWVNAPNTTNDIKYALPEDSLLNYFRRVSNICNVTGYSNVVKINVVRKDTVNSLNPLGSFGSIQGRIISKGGNPVKGDSVWVRKVLDLNGSPKEFSYYDTTNGDGVFTVKRIFYGKQGNLDGDPTDVKFYVMPLKYGHAFSKYSSDDTTNTTLNASNYDVELAPVQGTYTFKDLTAVTVIGRTYQQCDGCIPQIPGQLVQRGLDSVVIKVNDLNTGLKSQKTLDDKYGIFNYTVEDITQTYRFSPSYKNHNFDTTGNINVIKTNRDTVLNLRDTTNFNISGTFRAGCNEIIGRATLQFSDVPQTPERNSVFFYNVTTQTNGNYIVRLPAGKYKVKMLSFAPAGSGADLKVTNVTNFFSGDSISTAINPELLKVDISTTNATLNLIYQRPPTMQLIGWDSICKTNFNEGFDVWNQLTTRPLQIKVFQGPVSKGCPLAYDSVKIFTTVQTDGVEEILKVKVDSTIGINTFGIAKDTLKVGVPNINGDYTKSLFITYVDKYGSTASISKKVVVVGSRPRPGQTFETVSPLIPLMVVHDPPGDLSYARWKKTSSTETAMRFFVNSSSGATIWTEAKVGATFTTGVGFIALFSTDFSVWASINASASMKARNSTQNELIVNTETSEEIKTSADGGGIGSSGDIFYGGALNLVYGTTDDILFSNCQVTKKSSAIFAPNKIMTTYRYSENDIKNTIANLKLLALQTPSRADSLNNQANVWQQVLDNNNRNKANAAFVENKTFTGGGSSGESTISRSVTGSNTVEFAIEVEASLALELGLEIAGNGLKGGVTVNLQMEVGASFTNTSTSATEISYVLQDKDAGDKYTVNIARDPVYGTPVFETLAGLSSCPPEENTIARDEMTIVTSGPSEINVPAPDKVTNFDLIIGNNSIDPGTKPYNLFVLDNDGATIKADGVSIGGTSAFFGIQPIPQGGTQIVNIELSKRLGANSPFTYRNVKFIVTDVCSNKLYDATVTKQQLVSVNFASTCSNLNLAEPADGWVVKTSNQNKLNFLFDGYTPSGLNTVVVQYRLTGNSTWIDATSSTTKTAADLAGTTSYTLDLPVADLVDGKYDVRMKLVCTSGIIYTKSVSGLIDRKAPALFGIPDPTDGNYEPGDVISFSYDENIEVSTINSGNKVQLYRMSNNTLIPSTASGNANKIIITPGINLQQYLGDSVKVVVSNIYDTYGNGTTEPDVSKFTIGTLPPVISPAKPVKIYSVPVSMYENTNGAMQVHFKMDVLPKRPIVKVNFTIGGNATFSNDYNVTIPTLKTIVKNPFTGINEEIPLVSSFNGTQGYIYIDSNKSEAILTIIPVKDTAYEPDENIVINLSTGGDYNLSDSLTSTSTILNDDLQPPTIDSTGALTFCAGGSVILTAVTPNLVTRYATSVIRKSGEYSSTLWGAKQALGTPNVYPLYGDIQYAWSPTNPDNAREYLELGFSNPNPINFINIFETYNPGSIDTVFVKDASNNWVRVYAENAQPSGTESNILNITFPMTAFPVSAIRIAINSAVVPGFNEIDAVGIGLDTTYNSYQWSNGETTKSITVNTAGTYVCKVMNSVGQHAYSTPLTVTIIQPVGAITGNKKACVGKTAQLANATGGGTWSISDTSKAKISNTGLVTGKAAGTVVVTYSTPANGFGCLNVITTTFTVNALPTVAAITGSNKVCIGSSITLSNTTTGGTWKSSDTTVATITTAGLVKSKKVGTTNITYTTTANTNGCINVAQLIVTVNVLPTITAITGNNSVCVGSTTKLSNATTGGTWKSSDTTIATISTTGNVAGKTAGVVTITYTTAANTAGCTNKATLSITVNALPTPSVITGNKTICIAATSQLASTPNGGAWSCLPTTIATISSTGLATGVSTGTATVTYTVTGTGGCTKSITTSVFVKGLPIVAAINGKNNACVGATATLTDATTGGTWSSSDTSKASISSGGVVLGKASGVVTIFYTTAPNASGCTNQATLQFTVNAIPTVSAIGGLKTFCVATTSQLTNTTSGGVWSSVPTSIATINASTGEAIGKAAGTANVTYTVTGTGGCVKSTNTSIFIKGLPTVAAITGNTNVCLGNITTLSNTTSGGTWGSSDNNIATVSSAGIVVGVALGTVTISYTTAPNASGCTNVATVQVTVNALPGAGTITGSKLVCIGSTTQLSNTVTGGVWSSSDTNLAIVNSTGLVTGKAVGIANIIYTVTGNGGCKNSVSIAMNVKSLPTVAAITGTKSVCKNKTTQLSNSTTGGTWSSSNTAIATISSTGLVTGKSVGSVTITYTTAANASGCINKATALVTVSSACFSDTYAKGSPKTEESLPPTMEVSIFPNPTGNVFNLNVKSASKDKIDIKVLDINGKIAYRAKGFPGQTFHFGEKLMTGTYLVEVRQGEEVKTLKAVKIK